VSPRSPPCRQDPRTAPYNYGTTSRGNAERIRRACAAEGDGNGEEEWWRAPASCPLSYSRRRRGQDRARVAGARMRSFGGSRGLSRCWGGWLRLAPRRRRVCLGEFEIQNMSSFIIFQNFKNMILFLQFHL
jgi:hypothetical protein